MHETETETTMLLPWRITQLVHILVIAPFLIYVGLTRPQSSVYYLVLGLLGVLLLLNFTYKLMSAKSVRGWLVIHAYIFSALFLYMAWFGRESADISFSLLIAIGSAAAGYHAIRMLSAAMSSTPR